MAEQTITMPLGEGLDTYSDNKLVSHKGSLELLNADLSTPGSLKKRVGFDHLSIINDQNAELVPEGLWHYGNELLAQSDGDLYGRSEKTGKWESKGDFFPNRVKTKRVTSTSGDALRADMAQTNGIYVFQDYQDFKFFDAETDTLLYTYTITTSSSAAAVIASGQYIYVLFFAAGNDLDYVVYDTESPYTIGSSTTLVNGDITTLYDIDVMSNGDIVLAWYSSANTDARVLTFNDTGVVVSTQNITLTDFSSGTITGGGLSVVAAHGTGVFVCLTYKDSVGEAVYAFGRDESLTGALFAPTLMTQESANRMCGITAPGGSEIYFYWLAGDFFTPGTHTTAIRQSVTVGGTPGTRLVIGADRSFYAKPIKYTNKIFVPVLHHAFGALAANFDFNNATIPQATCFLIYDDGNEFTPHAKFFPGRSGRVLFDPATPDGHVPNSINIKDGQYRFPVLTQFENSYVGSRGHMPERSGTIVDVDFDFVPNAVLFADSIYFAASQVYRYDGSRVYEAGFHLAPEIQASGDTSGGSLPDGVYSISAYYVFRDTFGQIEYSGLAPTKTVTITGGGGNGHITMYSTMPVTGRPQDEVYITILMTEVDKTIFYELDPVAVDFTAETKQALGDITSEPVTTRKKSYADGEILEQGSPPGSLDIVRVKDRLFSVSSEGILTYSKKRIINEPANWVKESFDIDIRVEGDQWWQLGVMDGVVYAFGPGEVLAFSGDGLSATGAGAQLSGPHSVSTDDGIIDGSRVLATDMGIFFQSERGIMLLARARTIEFIGAAVQGLIGQDLRTIVLQPSKTRLLAVYRDGPVLSFDYVRKGWAVYREKAARHAVLYRGVMYVVEPDRTVTKEAGSHMDGLGKYALTVSTGWFALGGPVGRFRMSRVALFGEYRSPHKLNVEVYYDYNTEYTDRFEALIESDPGAYIYQFELSRQEMTSVRFRVYDTEQQDTCESMVLNAIGVQATPLADIAKNSARRLRAAAEQGE